MQMAAPAHRRRTALAPIVARARLATAKYATSLEAARKDGYTVNVTRMIPDMGWHFLNPKISGFDASKPPILVYEKRGSRWQLAAFEWVFTRSPQKRRCPERRTASFPAACHYTDGTFVPAAAETDCAKTSPESGAAFGFWHPRLRDAARLGLVPEPGRRLRGHEPARASLQRRNLRARYAAAGASAPVAASSSPNFARAHELADARLRDELAVLDEDVAAQQHDLGRADHLGALVEVVVDLRVLGRGRDRDALLRVEDDDVGVRADGERALARVEAEELRRVRRRAARPSG